MMTPGAAAEAVAPFDPWVSREAFVRLAPVSNGEQRRAQFRVEEPLRILAYALGEISHSGTLYDYGWIVRESTGETVWEMSRSASQKAGGDANNRVEMAFLRLEPGTYTAYYQTDDSHAYDDWRNGTPDHPERWGLSLFPLNAPFDTSAVQVLEAPAPAPDVPTPDVPTPDVPAPVAPAPPDLHGSGQVLLDATGLGNEERVVRAFELDETTALHIVAVGEISLSGRYDYGRIERADTGETVWEMTRENTRPAGGDDKNRIFNGMVTLPPGKYVVDFRTDFSHAFGDFRGSPPEQPDAWGIRIERVEE